MHNLRAFSLETDNLNAQDVASDSQSRPRLIGIHRRSLSSYNFFARLMVMRRPLTPDNFGSMMQWGSLTAKNFVVVMQGWSLTTDNVGSMMQWGSLTAKNLVVVMQGWSLTADGIAGHRKIRSVAMRNIGWSWRNVHCVA